MPPGRWDNAGRSTSPAPQSKPVTLASRLVARIAPLVAFGLWAENSGRRASTTTDSTPIAAFVGVNPKSRPQLS